jgi:hypothetical protein
MHQYRTRPENLVAELPHRDPASVGIVARNLTISCGATSPPALASLPTDSEEIATEKSELLRRINRFN